MITWLSATTALAVLSGAGHAHTDPTLTVVDDWPGSRTIIICSLIHSPWGLNYQLVPCWARDTIHELYTYTLRHQLNMHTAYTNMHNHVNAAFGFLCCKCTVLLSRSLENLVSWPDPKLSGRPSSSPAGGAAVPCSRCPKPVHGDPLRQVAHSR